MTVSRRNVLLQGCAIGVGVIATQMPGVVALAQGQPQLRRSSAIYLNDPSFRLGAGVRQLKQTPASRRSLGELPPFTERQRLQPVSARQLVLSPGTGHSCSCQADSAATARAQRLRLPCGIGPPIVAARGFSQPTWNGQPIRCTIAEVDVANHSPDEIVA
jgi:hypothetical protein